MSCFLLLFVLLTFLSFNSARLSNFVACICHITQPFLLVLIRGPGFFFFSNDFSADPSLPDPRPLCPVQKITSLESQNRKGAVISRTMRRICEFGNIVRRVVNEYKHFGLKRVSFPSPLLEVQHLSLLHLHHWNLSILNPSTWVGWWLRLKKID